MQAFDEAGKEIKVGDDYLEIQAAMRHLKEVDRILVMLQDEGYPLLEAALWPEEDGLKVEVSSNTTRCCTSFKEAMAALRDGYLSEDIEYKDRIMKSIAQELRDEADKVEALRATITEET